jgi:hypothetical protein
MIDLVLLRALDPVKVLANVEPKQNVIDAYKAFDNRDWAGSNNRKRPLKSGPRDGG